MGSHRSYREHKYEFGRLLLALRTRTSLTQSELADEIGVHRRSVQNWETGESYPKAEALQRLIAACLRHRAFAKGKEREEAQTLWQQAAKDSPQALAHFDEAWFGHILASSLQTLNQNTPTPVAAPPSSPPRPEEAPAAPLASVLSVPPKATTPIIDWGEITATPRLYGRDGELETLERWVVHDKCRVVSILGLGGIGKSSLAITFARRFAPGVAPDFDLVLFRSLQNGPALGQVLDQIIRAVSDQQSTPTELLSDKIAQVVQLFRGRRCLLILDNFETILQPGTLTGTYRTGYADYGLFLRGLSEREHQSCLMLTSREKPTELGPLEGRSAPVRTLNLSGLAESACQVVLEAKELVGTTDELRALARLYGGNPLALNLVSEPILEIFGGNVAAFLATDDAFFNGMGRLLDQQFARSTPLEQSILYWLAIERELVPFNVLVANVGEGVPQRDVLAALESLRRRMQIERSPDRPAFTLQPLILEYITEQLVDSFQREIMAGQPHLLPRYTLVNATAKEYVRLSQERLIATPLLEQLVASCRGTQGVTDRLFALLAQWRGQAGNVQGYGPGNVVNLLRLLRGDVIGLDFSNLVLRNVYLQGVAAHDANLSGSQLLQSVFQEPFAGIESVACSPDMRYMAVGTVNGEIRLWEVASRTTLLAVKAHTGPVVGLALSADGHLLASGSADGTCRLWKVTTGQNLAILKGHSSVVWTVALSTDRRLLASGSGDGTVRLWDIHNLYNCECIAILEGHTSAVRSVALAQGGRLLVSGSFDGTVRLWNTAHRAQDVARVSAHDSVSGKAAAPVCLAILRGHHDAIRSVALTPDGRLVASGSVDQSVRLWDTSMLLDAPTLLDAVGNDASEGAAGLQNPPCIATLTGHGDVIRSVALSADGRLLASGSGDKTVRLWEIAPQGAGVPHSATCIAILEGHTNAVMSIALAADGQTLMSGSTDGTVRLWGARNGTCLAILEGHTNAVMSVALAAHGRMLASGGTDGKVRLWDAQSGENLVTLHGHTNMVMGVAFSGDGQLLVSGSGDGTMRLWDVSNLHKGSRCLSVLEGHTNVVRGIAWSADGRLLASASYDGTVRLWDIRRGTSLFTLYGHTNMVMSVAFSQDGRLLASGSFDGTVRLWDTSTIFSGEGETPRSLAVLRDHTAVVYGVTLSADGRWLASCSFDRTVRLWDTALVLNHQDDHAPLGTIISEEYKGEAWSVALSADGQALASGDTEGNVHLWKINHVTASKSAVDLFEGHSSAIWSVAISPDGQLVVSGSGDGTVRLWDGASATLLRTLRAARPYERMDIRGLTGITEAQRASLIALGAIG